LVLLSGLSFFNHIFDQVDDIVDADRGVEAGIIVFVVAEFVAGEVAVVVAALLILALDQVGIGGQVVSVYLLGAFFAEFHGRVNKEVADILSALEDIIPAAADDDAALLVRQFIEDLPPGAEDPVRDGNDAAGGIDAVEEA